MRKERGNENVDTKNNYGLHHFKKGVCIFKRLLKQVKILSQFKINIILNPNALVQLLSLKLYEVCKKVILEKY